jgi:hypothetical protein
MNKELPSMMYKVERRSKVPDCKKKRQKLSPQTSAKMKNTQSWLDSLPMPPKREFAKPSRNKLPTAISFKKKKGRVGNGNGGDDSDVESLGRWSCRSIRTYKSFKKPRKRGANFVEIDREARSEIGWGQYEGKISQERNYRSEY